MSVEALELFELLVVLVALVVFAAAIVPDWMAASSFAMPLRRSSNILARSCWVWLAASVVPDAEARLVWLDVSAAAVVVAAAVPVVVDVEEAAAEVVGDVAPVRLASRLFILSAGT